MKLAPIICLFAALNVQASDWYPLGVTGKEDNVVEIDRDSISRDGHRVSVWEKITLITPRALPDGRYYSTIKSFVAINCERKTIATLEFIAYDHTGDTVADTQAADPKPLRIVPDSVAERVANAVCKK